LFEQVFLSYLKTISTGAGTHDLNWHLENIKFECSLSGYGS